MEENTFSLYELLEPTNESFIVTFTPGGAVQNYEVILYKDGIEYKKEEIKENKKIDILLNETGTYNINVLIDDKIIKSGNYIIDKEAPVIEITKKVITIKQGKNFNPNDYIIVHDNYNDYTIETNYETIDLNKIGAQTITYKVKDKSGNLTTKSVIVNIKKNNDTTLKIYYGIFSLFILFLMFLLVWYQKKQKKFNRVNKYSVQGIKTKNPSLIDHLVKIYMNILKFIVRILNSSSIFKKLGNKYNKYIPLCSLNIKNGITLIAHKILFGLVFLIASAFSKAFLEDVISFEEGLLIFIIGYYLLDIKYMILYKKYHEKIENDLLESVVIMNNAFKVGASPEQAIKVVSEEMNDVIGLEYKQIYSEIKFGLSINDAFTRLSERLNLKEAEYIAASLEILNNTGGDVIKIFDSIEKNLFDQRKVKNEYKALTGSPKMISNFLFCLPIIFVLIILIINKDYFNPLFKSGIGIILIIASIMIYILYIVIIKKIFKIRM